MLLPVSEDTRGHGTHTYAGVWHDELRRFFDSSFDVHLERLPGGRTAVLGRLGPPQFPTSGLIDAPPNWLADSNPEGIHERRYRLRPATGYGELDIIVSGALYDKDPGLDDGRPVCINGTRGEIERFSGSWTHIVLWHPGNNDGKSDDWPHYVYMSYPSKDAVAAKIARSYRVSGHKKQC